MLGGCSFTFSIELRLSVDLTREDEGTDAGAGETVSVGEDSALAFSLFETGWEGFSRTTGTVGIAFSPSGGEADSNSIFFLSLLQEKSCH